MVFALCCVALTHVLTDLLCARMPCAGRYVLFNVRIDNKPTRDGIKVLAMACATSGYVLLMWLLCFILLF